MLFVLDSVAAAILLIVPLVVAIAYFTLAERKVMASIQRRSGPNVVQKTGLLQPLADALKLVVKEIIVPVRARSGLFLAAPVLTFFLSLVAWAVVPFSKDNVIAGLELGVLYIFTVSSLSTYGVILAGWASNSKYAHIGALRSVAQMVSYEVSIGLNVIPVVLVTGSLNLMTIVHLQHMVFWNCYLLFPCFLLFVISVVAETNRAPFDLPEAEAELVAGFNVEYSSITFALFFLGEYCSMILMSAFAVLLFVGGWIDTFNWFFLLVFLFIGPFVDFFYTAELVFSIKITSFCYFFIFLRANLPRYRYDQLMGLGWKAMLPLSLGYLSFVATLLYIFDVFPKTAY